MRWLLPLFCFLSSLTIPAHAEIDCCSPYGKCWYSGFEIGGEWLYWKAEQSQMELANEYLTTAPVTTLTAIRPNFSSHSGYRVFADYEVAKCWVFEGSYTHVGSHATVSKVLDPANFNLNGIQINIDNLTAFFPLILAAYSSFEARWELDIDYFDLDMGKVLNVCRCIEIFPHVGFRGFWMRQKINTVATGPLGGATFAGGKFYERFWATGIEGGLSGTWNIGWGFQVIGNIGGALLYAHVKAEQKTVTTSAPLININSSDLRKNIGWLEYFIGLQYTAPFCGSCCSLHFGWENHLILDTQQFANSEGGNLTMQGITLGGNLSF